jgi:hypothetical protein
MYSVIKKTFKIFFNTNKKTKVPVYKENKMDITLHNGKPKYYKYYSNSIGTLKTQRN